MCLRYRVLDVKISYPGAPQDANLSQFCGNLENRWGACIFHVNSDIAEADAWIVIEDVIGDEESCAVPNGNLIFASAESALPDDEYFPEGPGGRFLTQFDKAYSPHAIFGVAAASTPLFLPWHINGNHGLYEGPDPVAPSSRDIHTLDAMGPISKTQDISVFCSVTDMTPTHRLRFKFTERIVSHFGSRIQWFGNGVNSIDEKWKGLAPFRYTIVLENRSDFNFITEKVGDAFLAYSYPFYWGAPNLSDYFPEAAFKTINIRDLDRSIATIEEALDTELFEVSKSSLATARNRVLYEFNWLARMTVIVEDAYQEGQAHARSVRSRSSFRVNSTLGQRVRHLARSIRDSVRN